MQHGSIRAGIGHLDGHEHISGVRFCVVDVDNPVAVIIECAGVEKFVLEVILSPPAVFPSELFIRKGPLWVVVSPTVPGMARHGVEVPPIFLDIFTMVGLRAGKPESPLFQNGSWPFQSASARHKRCSISQKPASPSSPQR